MAVWCRMKKRYDVAVVGEVFTDHIFSGFDTWPAPGVEIFTEQYARELGGGAPNTASALARLGRDTLLFGIAGITEQLWLEARLAAFGVQREGVKYVNNPTGVTVSISTKEERTFFTYPGANVLLPEYIASPPVVSRLCEARHVHFAMPLAQETAANLFPQLKNAACTLSLDVGWQIEWLTDQSNLQTCAACDFFLPNFKEAQILTGAETVSAMLRACRDAGLSGVVLKLGGQGAAMLSNGQEIYSPSCPVEAVDTTGAGDAFNAGLIDAALDSVPAKEMLRRACICGALSTRVAGALNGLPTRKEVEEFHGQASQS